MIAPNIKDPAVAWEASYCYLLLQHPTSTTPVIGLLGGSSADTQDRPELLQRLFIVIILPPQNQMFAIYRALLLEC